MTMTKEEAQKAYDDLIAYRQQNVLVKSKENPGKIEVHHIVPISIGGLDEDLNRIALLAKEHFMAHVYLWIIHHDDQFHDQMTGALMNMHKGTKNGNRKELRDFILMSEDYQQAREEFGKIASKMLSEANKGEKNPHFGKHWYKDPNSKKCSLFKEGEQPNGWIRGKYLTENECNSHKIKGKVWIYNDKQHINKFVTADIAMQLTSTKEWQYGHMQKPISQDGLANIRESAKKRQYTYCQPSNKGKFRYINATTEEIKYFGENDEIPARFTKVKKTSKHSIEEQILTKEFNKHQHEIAKAKWIQSVQDMADYFTKYGYEATCKKFNVNMSPESMIMKFIRTRKLYGINFISQPGKKRKFQTLPEE